MRITDLTDEQIAQAKNCANQEELGNYLESIDVELDDDALDTVLGGKDLSAKINYKYYVCKKDKIFVHARTGLYIPCPICGEKTEVKMFRNTFPRSYRQVER